MYGAGKVAKENTTATARDQQLLLCPASAEPEFDDATLPHKQCCNMFVYIYTQMYMQIYIYINIYIHTYT